MKKLLLILSAVLVSGITLAQDNNTAGLAYTLNPYAYDLSSSWDASTQQLTVRFKLNAPPNLNGSGYNDVSDGEPNGIQIYAIDPEGNRYRIGGPGRGDIKTAHVNNNGQYEYTMDLSAGKSVGGANPGVDIPKNVPLTWEVLVKGRSKRGNTHITARPTGFKRPRYVLGVAVGKNPKEPNFGRIFTTELEDGSSSSETNSPWHWLYSDALLDKYYKESHQRMPAMLEYSPQLNFLTVHKKYVDDQTENSHFSTQKYSEPHRVRVAEDGRIFVSSYHQGAGAAVKEYLGNNTFRTVIGFDLSENKDTQNSTGYPSLYNYNRRAIDFDVKGSGDDLKIIVAWIKPKGSPATGNNTQWNATVEIYEYEVGKNYDLHQTRNGTLVAKYTESNPNNTLCGYLFQSYFRQNWAAERALVGVAYGSGEKDIWLKVDPGLNPRTNSVKDRQSQILYFDGVSQSYKKNTYIPTTDCQTLSQSCKKLNNVTETLNGDYYGGGSIIVKGNKLYTYVATGKLRAYTINADGSLTNPTDLSLEVSAPWANGFAIDYANNLYMVSEWLGDIKTIALQYSGALATPAPEGYEFTLSSEAKPNIYASHLRYGPDGSSDKYKFSFRTNTKPTHAELRFYKVKNVDKMNSNIETIHADDYDSGKHTTHDPDYVYTFESTELQQGLMEKSLTILGGDVDNPTITDALPPGELYWSVYVETDKSTFFAPIYKQNNSGVDAHYRLHATVNNYPATDMFGSIIVAQNDQRTNKKNSLMVYSINPNSRNGSCTLNNTDRYSLVEQYYPQNNSDFNKPRRMYVAPDGKVFIANEGEAPTGHPTTVAIHSHGGIRVWDPQDPVSDSYLKTTLFSNNKINTSSAVALYKNNNGTWELHATNTYSEFAVHNVNSTLGYTDEEKKGIYAWNGLVKYNNLTIDSKGIFNWTTGNYADVATEYALGLGDASGNISIAPMDQGVWMCQHREHNVKVKEAGQQSYPDNNESYILSFVPYGSTNRTWRSCTTYGKINEPTAGYLNRYPKSSLTQTPSSPLQSTPGGGLAYKKVKVGDNKYREYLFMPNHDGDIVVLEITSWSYRGTNQAKPKVEYRKTLYTPASTKGTLMVYNTKITTGAITSINFDYAGNLVTTTGVVYFDMGYTFYGEEPANVGAQDVIIYTMPYDRTNAQEIRASDSQYYIPERISQTYDKHGEIITPYLPNSQGGVNKGTCGLDIFRPMLSGSFNTICLPFDLASLEGTPYEGATVMKYTGASYRMQNGEGMVDLNFQEIAWGTESMQAGEPHLIQLGKDNQGKDKKITGIVRFKEIQFETTQPEDKDLVKVEVPNGITLSTEPKAMYQGIFDKKSDWDDEDLPALILVDQNRLAEVFSSGTMQGFRGYFRVTDMPSGTTYSISSRKPIATGLVDHKGRPINIEKYLREGRVYIRVGDTLYTLDGKRL